MPSTMTDSAYKPRAQRTTRRAALPPADVSPTGSTTVHRDGWLDVNVRGSVPPALDGRPPRRSNALPPITRSALRLIEKLDIEGLTYTANGGAGILIWEKATRTWYSLRCGSALEAIHLNCYGSEPRNRRAVREAYRLLTECAKRHHITFDEWKNGAAQDVFQLVTDVAASLV